MLSLLCAWARHLKTRTQRSQAICTSVLSASKTPVNQKICHLNALHLYPAQTRKQTKKELPNSYIKLLNYRHPFDFYRKRGLGPDHSHHNRSRLWSRLHTALAQITRIALKWIYTVFKIFSQFTIFALALKNRVSLKIFTVLNILFTLRIFNNLRLPWKKDLPWNFSLYWIYFLHSDFLSNLRLPWKAELPWIFHCIEYTFYIHEFWTTHTCPEKQRVPWIHCTEYVLFIIQDFWATSACPEKKSCPGIFHCIEYVFFIIQDFWATCAYPENRVCPEIFQGRPPASYACVCQYNILANVFHRRMPESLMFGRRRRRTLDSFCGCSRCVGQLLES